MSFSFSQLGQYILHDSSVNSIITQDTTLQFLFKEGYFDMNHQQYSNCSMSLIIEKLRCFPIDSVCYIEERKGKRISTLTFASFTKLVKKYAFVIESEYYSLFENAILLLGNIKNKFICIKITDIDSISFATE